MKNTMVEIVVSSGGLQAREATLKIDIAGVASGEFEFRYYIDGTLQQNLTEVKNLSLIDKFQWTFTNSGVHEYAVRVRSLDTGAEGTFFSCMVDFTKDPPNRDYGDTFNGKVFKQLLSAVPVEENSNVIQAESDQPPEELNSEPEGQGRDEPVASAPAESLPNDSGQIVAEG